MNLVTCPQIGNQVSFIQYYAYASNNAIDQLSPGQAIRWRERGCVCSPSKPNVRNIALRVYLSPPRVAVQKDVSSASVPTDPANSRCCYQVVQRFHGVNEQVIIHHCCQESSLAQ